MGNSNNDIKNINIVFGNKEIKNFYLKKFVLEEEINNHKSLKIKFEISEEEREYFERSIENKDLELKIEIKDKTEIFKGILEYFEILNYGSKGYEVNIKAFSKSRLLDNKMELKYRVFQDKNMTFENVVSEISKEYTGKIEIKSSNVAKQKIENFIVQYEETDWEFLVRIASFLGIGLFITEKGLITFGNFDTNEIKEENKFLSDFSMVRDIDNLYYKINSQNIISLGNKIALNKNNVYDSKKDNKNKESENIVTVVKAKIYLENNILKSEVLATELNEYIIYRKYNEKIKGCCIEARVERVFSQDNSSDNDYINKNSYGSGNGEKGIAKMEVSFFEGLQKIVGNIKEKKNKYKCYKDYGIERTPLSYQTFYSQTNTGFFCTPEINDVVEVYFPSKDEADAKVSWSINNDGNGRFSNYEKRNFHVNGSDFNFNLNKNIFEMNIDKSYTRNSKSSIESAESLINKGTKNVIIVCDDYVGIESIGEMAIYGKNMEIIGKEKSIRIETPDEIRIKGKKVHNN